MILLSPPRPGHLNHCQIQQTGLRGSSTYLRVSPPAGRIRGGCTTAGVRRRSSSRSTALPQPSPCSTGAPAAFPAPGRSACPRAATEGQGPAAAGPQTRPSWGFLLPASYGSPFSSRGLRTPVPSCRSSQADSARELARGFVPQTPTRPAVG